MNANINLESNTNKNFFIKNLFKYFNKQEKNPDIWIIVLHPVEYQIPFYKSLYQISKGNSLVLFMDNMTIKPHKCSTWGKETTLKVRESTKPKNYKFKYFFSKNFSLNKEKTFFNRINFDIILGVIFFKPKIALITSYTSFTSLILLLLSPCLKTKICLRAEGGLIGRPWLRNRKTTTRRLVDWLINRADYFFYSCEDNKEYFLVRGMKSDNLYPLLSSVDSDFFGTEVSNLPKKDYEYFLMASKLEKRKNIIEAIEGFKEYTKSRFNSYDNSPYLLIAGVGPEFSFLKKEAAKHNILFLDYIEDKEQIRELIQGSIGIVISSFYDPTPKIVNEALSCSKPVLCRETVGFAGNLIEHKKNGYIYKYKKKKDILDGYQWLQKNSNNDSVKNFCKNKSKIWSPQQNANSVLELYRNLKER